MVIHCSEMILSSITSSASIIKIVLLVLSRKIIEFCESASLQLFTSLINAPSVLVTFLRPINLAVLGAYKLPLKIQQVQYQLLMQLNKVFQLLNE